MLKRSVIGILAHVDAGKTTLSEAMLYTAGSLRILGRVDHGDAFLDTFSLERQRGITIFSKQAVLQLPRLRATLLDTPGHVDFSAEMERTLDVLDCAILVVSGSSGVQSHTLTVWKLLRQRNVPTLLFVNKMDLPGTERESVLRDLRSQLSERICVLPPEDPEELALCDEALLEEFLNTGDLTTASITAAVQQGRIFPVWFGSALKLQGVSEFMEALETYAPQCNGGREFGARVYKISRDEQNQRMSHMKITGGVLHVRDTLPIWRKGHPAAGLFRGEISRPWRKPKLATWLAALGLSQTYSGQGLGAETASEEAAGHDPGAHLSGDFAGGGRPDKKPCTAPATGGGRTPAPCGIRHPSSGNSRGHYGPGAAGDPEGAAAGAIWTGSRIRPGEHSLPGDHRVHGGGRGTLRTPPALCRGASPAGAGGAGQRTCLHVLLLRGSCWIATGSG